MVAPFCVNPPAMSSSGRGQLGRGAAKVKYRWGRERMHREREEVAAGPGGGATTLRACGGVFSVKAGREIGRAHV